MKETQANALHQTNPVHFVISLSLPVVKIGSVIIVVPVFACHSASTASSSSHQKGIIVAQTTPGLPGTSLISLVMASLPPARLKLSQHI